MARSHVILATFVFAGEAVVRAVSRRPLATASCEWSAHLGAALAAIALGAVIGAIYRRARRIWTWTWTWTSHLAMAGVVILATFAVPTPEAVVRAVDVYMSVVASRSVAAFAAISLGARIGAIGLGARRRGANTAVGGIVHQTTFIPSIRKVAGARFEHIAFAILAAACATIALGARIGVATLLGAVRAFSAAATVDCDDCVVREDGPDNLERSHMLQSGNPRYRSG